ncbi:MAG: class I SAM-dependent methyltransferase [Vicinamibacteria bacterium]|nr:class I SAM-dependent methyltransferase [Vicinamibacteria bacterium]
MSHYGTDLAFVHDRGFASFSERAAPFLIELLRARGLAGGHVVELGCGGGQLAAALLAAGFEVTAVDHSPAFVALTRRHAPRARVVRASAFGFEPPACDAVLAIGEVLGYTGPGGTSASARRRLFARCARALSDGGLLAFDFATPALARTAGRRHFAEGPGWACLVETRATGRRLERRIVTFRERARGWRREETTHHLELLDPAELTAQLRAAGFAVRRLPGYGSQPMLPGRAALLAVRRRRLKSTSARSKSRP